jgi:peptidoglycan/xylan/chitin deacetylase (PgdA/CDA1 family)
MGAQRIFTLHGIGSPHQGVPSDEPFYWVTQQAFVSLLQIIVAGRETSTLPIDITFDDGNESDAVIALPELAKRDLSATFFVVPLPGSTSPHRPYLSGNGDRNPRHESLRLAQAR